MSNATPTSPENILANYRSTRSRLQHLLNLAIGGLVMAGQLRLWASESCSTCYTPES